MPRKLILLEPSKVGNQHITVISSYLEALVHAARKLSKAEGKQVEVEAQVSKSTFKNLPPALKETAFHKRVAVMNPENGILPIKVLLEVLVTIKAVIFKKPDDIILVTCMLSPALFLLELFGRARSLKGVFVTLHGETEAIADPEIGQGIASYGYWIRIWWKTRPRSSSLGLVVIDRFIREKLEDHWGPERRCLNAHALVLPIRHLALPQTRSSVSSIRVCFIGYRSRFKGFETFEELAKRRTDIEWIAIGGGTEENLRSGKVRSLESSEAYHKALAACDVALFPYKRAYDVSLSAAVIDAIAAGLYAICSNRGCFEALSGEFGERVVKCYQDPKEIDGLLDAFIDNFQDYVAEDRAKVIGDSNYSHKTLNSQMLKLVKRSS